MKIKFLLFFICLQLNAQTLKVNENRFLSIVFDSNISQGVLGNNDYIFEFNTDGTEKVALLKAGKKEAKPSNLIIKTVDGFLYNINLEYGQDSKNIIKLSQSEGMNLNPSAINSADPGGVDKPQSNAKINIRENDYTIGNTIINDAESSSKDCDYCAKILKLGKKIKRINSINYNVKLDLENVTYFDNKIFISINIINKSNIDFNINYIKSYIKQSKETASSNQYLEKNPLEIFNASRVIKTGAEHKIIFIYDQFTIDKNKSLVFELNEANGERNQTLFIPNYIINNPIKLN